MPRYHVDMNLMEFYGIGCDHCDDMKPHIAQVEKEIRRSFARYEVWENEKNLKILQKLDRGLCGGIPFFYNRKTRDYICSATSADNLKNWALGKPNNAFTQAEKKPFGWDDLVKETQEKLKGPLDAVKQIQQKIQPKPAVAGKKK
eukprot:EC120298.1.p1 GENE.EC120298.1~~EC120298.1.p1  ORF type:complete len:145 (+),score=26.13 EC120298.1:84-518(+)